MFVSTAADLIDDNGDLAIDELDVTVDYVDASGGGNTGTVSSVNDSIPGNNLVVILISGDGYATGDTLAISNGAETVNVAELLESEGPSAVLEVPSTPFFAPGVDLASVSYADADGTNVADLLSGAAITVSGENHVNLDISGDGFATGDTLILTIGDGHEHGADDVVTEAVESRISVVQEDAKHFVYTVDKDADGDPDEDKLRLKVELLPQVIPGWYSISFETEALETDLDNVG